MRPNHCGGNSVLMVLETFSPGRPGFSLCSTLGSGARCHSHVTCGANKGSRHLEGGEGNVHGAHRGGHRGCTRMARAKAENAVTVTHSAIGSCGAASSFLTNHGRIADHPRRRVAPIVPLPAVPGWLREDDGSSDHGVDGQCSAPPIGSPAATASPGSHRSTSSPSRYPPVTLVACWACGG